MKILLSQPKLLTHLAIVFIALCLRSWLSGSMSQALNVWPSASESHSWVSLFSGLTDVLLPSLPGFRGDSFLCGLRAKIVTETFSRHSGAVSKMPKITSPLCPSMHEHIERPTYIHPYIYTYTHLLHTVTIQTAMCWDSVFLHFSKSIMERAFNHSQPSLKMPSTSLLAFQEHYRLYS